MRKFYIAYEGVDGSGTSTQAEMMAELLRGEALARGSGEVHLVREPNNNLPLSSMLPSSTPTSTRRPAHGGTAAAFAKLTPETTTMPKKGEQLQLEVLLGEVVAATGHRPNDREPWRGVGGWADTWLHQGVWRWLEKRLVELRPRKITAGGAVGVDTWTAQLALQLGIPLTLAIPFEGQELEWPEKSQRLYWEIRERANEVVNVSMLDARRFPGGRMPVEPMRKAMDARNRWMVDRCTLLLEVWDGSPGGTGNCVRYAEKLGRRFLRLDPATLREDRR